MNFRIGFGFDVHQLADGLDFNLGDLDLSKEYTEIDFEIKDITGELDPDG